MDFMKEYEKWLASPVLSADERAELESIRRRIEQVVSAPGEPPRVAPLEGAR